MKFHEAMRRNSVAIATTAPKGATQRTAAQGANRPQQAASGGRGGQRRGAPPTANVEEAITQAQHGRVNVTPAKAIEMAGKLYTRRQYRQAERVCRQIIGARPANADAHNILGVSLEPTDL